MSTPAETAPRLEYFAERLNTVWAHFFCMLEFEDDEDLADDSQHNARAWMLRTIQNGCLNATLLAIRDLDDFFARSPKSRTDDLRATDFGYSKGKRFLTKAEREDINKFVAHSTIHAAHAPERRWPIWDLAEKCMTACFAFLEWAKTDLGSDAACLLVAIPVRTHAMKIHAALAAEVARRRTPP